MSHQCSVEEKDQVPQPTASIFPNVALDSVGFFLLHWGLILSLLSKDPKTLLYRAAFLMVVPRCAGPWGYTYI